MISKISTILTIAGSDSVGGAGIQADIKTASSLGCFVASAITNVTCQNTMGVFGNHEVPTDIVRKQISLVLEDVEIGAMKTGMLSSAGIIEAVVDALSLYRKIPLVVDPVMISTTGFTLICDEATESLKKNLIPIAYLLTPNLPEAAALVGSQLNSRDDIIAACRKLQDMGTRNVLLKGGHYNENDDIIENFLLEENGKLTVFTSPRIKDIKLHGTGCTLSAAIASYLALGYILIEAIEKAIRYVETATSRFVTCGRGVAMLGMVREALKTDNF